MGKWACPSMTIFISGASGHVGVFTVAEFVKKGYQVHTTVRDLSKVSSTKHKIQTSANLTLEQVESIKFFEADLEKEEGWKEAMEGCSTVVHLAYPFVNGVPLEQLHKAAVEGSMNIFKLAVASPSVDHFIFCSTIGTIAFGEVEEGHIIDESDWTPLGLYGGYVDSKIIVEKAMWDYANSDENMKSHRPIALTCLNPFAIFGPVPDGATSYAGALGAFNALFLGKGPLMQGVCNITDVRDLAEAFVTVLEVEQARGERYIISSAEEISFVEAYDWMREKFPVLKEPQSLAPVRVTSRLISIENAKTKLGFKPRPAKESILATAKTMLKNLGLLE